MELNTDFDFAMAMAMGESHSDDDFQELGNPLVGNQSLALRNCNRNFTSKPKSSSGQPGKKSKSRTAAGDQRSRTEKDENFFEERILSFAKNEAVWHQRLEASKKLKTELIARKKKEEKAACGILQQKKKTTSCAKNEASANHEENCCFGEQKRKSSASSNLDSSNKLTLHNVDTSLLERVTHEEAEAAQNACENTFGMAIKSLGNEAVLDLQLYAPDNKISGCQECLICGAEFVNTSLTELQLHTNSCLDKLEKPEAREAGHMDTNALERADVTPVVNWLEKLNLSRYASLFIKEEIDWDTLQWLTDEDLSTLGIAALGPRRKIVCALKELKKQGASSSSLPEAHGPTDQSHSAPRVVIAKKHITDFFGNGSERLNSGTTANDREGSGRKRSQRRPPMGGVSYNSIPPWMCIPGTSFQVDAFKHLSGDCSNYFLTHFHTDHYQGLTRGFRHGVIYCSPTTARLVTLRIGVPAERLQIIPLNETVIIDGVQVTFIDANHCPGSVMILFEPPNGKPVLHTGDFRFCQEMAENVKLQESHIDTLILDTTYCNPQYNFPKQETVVQFVVDAIQAEAFNTRTLFLIGTYNIGKERIFLEVGKVLEKKVYVATSKLRLLECMELGDDYTKWLTTNELESHIHVVPLWSIASFKRMGSISRYYQGRYNSIVGFSPTGWNFGRDKKRTPGRRWQQGTIIRYEVPYSEHCSFAELREFVQFIAPRIVIPSVESATGQSADDIVAALFNEEA
ncbi:unnamed protein product [Sphagnum compactum]